MKQAAQIRQLKPDDVPAMYAVLDMFGEAFEMPEAYSGNQPSEAWLRDLLSNPGFVAVAAFDGAAVVGALAAYEYVKFEQERREFYIYDLAVIESHRRRGIARGMIEHLRDIAAARGAYVIIVQADHGDDPAIALYSGLGQREEVLHFDIPVPAAD